MLILRLDIRESPINRRLRIVLPRRRVVDRQVFISSDPMLLKSCTRA